MESRCARGSAVCAETRGSWTPRWRNASACRGVGTSKSIVVTHDVQLARASEVVLVLDQGHLVELGPPEQVLDAPRHEATRRLLAQASE